MAMPNLLKSITPCFILVVAALLIPLELRPKDSKMSETDTLARRKAGGGKAAHAL